MGSQSNMTESPFLSTQQKINDHLEDSGLSNHQWVNYFSLALTCITISLILLMAFQLWKQNGMIKELQEERKTNPAEQHYENNEIALYNNTHTSVTFSPNPHYGDNEEDEHIRVFSPNPYYASGGEDREN